MDNDGRPETLRLLYAAPRRWLQDGSHLHLRKAPTAFGELSIDVDCQLDQGRATVQVAVPPRPIQRFSLRLPLPAGWKAVSAHLDDQSLLLGPDATVDLTGRQGSFSVQYRVTRADPAAR
jgi:hypothetical protein